MTDTPAPDDDLAEAVAVVGMSARVPGAADLDRFWAALVAGEDLTTPLDAGGAYGIVAGGEWFDAAFFGIARSEALLLDPQQRMFLECCWEALEDAGADLDRSGAVGVYAGSGETDHLARLRAHRHLLPDATDATDARLRLAAGRDHLTTRVAHALDLRGPAVTVHTACSTSLAAVHLAAQALLAGDTDLALAGGITLRPDPAAEDGDGLLSPQGRCRPFDADADGMVDADGAGVVVLKRLSDAVDDGDHVEAVLLGSALSNDGARKASFSAPGVAGQVSAVRAAHLAADVPPESIDVVEAHGTGTVIGDTIEVRALTEAFGPPAGDRRCLLGAVKSAIGHADAAAGVLGLIKTILSLRHGVVPGTAHLRTPNPHLDLEAGPFRVSGETLPWPAGAHPRRAGVHATGVGGTSVHLVVQEAPATGPADPDDGPHLLPLSARTAPALARSAALLRDRLRRTDLPAPGLADVAWTLQTGRAAFAHRAVVVCRDRADAVAALTALASGSGPGDPAGGRAAPGTPPRVGFLFRADDRWNPRATRALYAREPAFRASVDDCVAQAGPELGPALLARLTIPAPAAPGGDPLRDPLPDPLPPLPDPLPPLPDPLLDRVAAVAARCAVVALWRARGIDPAALVASGSGSYAAAVADGLLSFPDAVALIRAGTAVGERAPADLGVLDVLVDVGPDGPAPDGAAPDGPAGPLRVRSVPAADAPDDAVTRSLDACGALWRAGVPVHWPALHDGRRPRRVALPTYPFERERLALDGDAPPADPGPPDPAPDPAPGDDTPRTPVERAVADLWCAVLGVPRVGLDDDFFDLGGHSLLATRVLRRLGPAVGRDVSHLSLLDLFDHATIRELAALVGEDDPTGGTAP